MHCSEMHLLSIRPNLSVRHCLPARNQPLFRQKRLKMETRLKIRKNGKHRHWEIRKFKAIIQMVTHILLHLYAAYKSD